VHFWPVKHGLSSGKVHLGLTHSKLMLAAARLVSAPTVKRIDRMLNLTEYQQSERQTKPRPEDEQMINAGPRNSREYALQRRVGVEWSIVVQTATTSRDASHDVAVHGLPI
jgi:hypothetical protein